jgi:hypothetical protein
MSQRAADTLDAQSMLILGGIDFAGGEDEDGHILESVDAFDTHAGAWTSLAPMHTPRVHPCACGLGAFVFAVGGYNESEGLLATTERFDSALDSWTTVAPMGTARFRFGLCALDARYLFAAGGDDGDITSSVERYDAQTNVWTDVAPLQTPRKDLALCALGGSIYAVGGYAESGGQGGGSDLASVEKYDSATNSWTCEWRT